MKRLPEADKDSILFQLLRGDETHLRTELLCRYHGEPVCSTDVAGGRSAGQLLAAAEDRWTRAGNGWPSSGRQPSASAGKRQSRPPASND